MPNYCSWLNTEENPIKSHRLSYKQEQLKENSTFIRYRYISPGLLNTWPYVGFTRKISRRSIMDNFINGKIIYELWFLDQSNINQLLLSNQKEKVNFLFYINKQYQLYATWQKTFWTKLWSTVFQCLKQFAMPFWNLERNYVRAIMKIYSENLCGMFLK